MLITVFAHNGKDLQLFFTVKELVFVSLINLAVL